MILRALSHAFDWLGYAAVTLVALIVVYALARQYVPGAP